MDNLYINKKGPKNKGLIIGLAVGIAVAVIAIIILVVVLVGSGDDKDNTEKTHSPTATARRLLPFTEGRPISMTEA